MAWKKTYDSGETPKVGDFVLRIRENHLGDHQGESCHVVEVKETGTLRIAWASGKVDGTMGARDPSWFKLIHRCEEETKEAPPVKPVPLWRKGDWVELKAPVNGIYQTGPKVTRVDARVPWKQVLSIKDEVVHFIVKMVVEMDDKGYWKYGKGVQGYPHQGDNELTLIHNYGPQKPPTYKSGEFLQQNDFFYHEGLDKYLIMGEGSQLDGYYAFGHRGTEAEKWRVCEYHRMILLHRPFYSDMTHS